MKDISKIIEKINKLPPMPEVIGKILRISEDPAVSAKEIIEIVQYDQNITANILRLCNSSYYSLPHHIASLNDAIVLLGNKVLFNLILASYTADMLSRKNQGYILDKGQLWEHSVSCAILSKEIASRTHYEDEQLAYSTGLLHDTGKVILDKFLYENYNKILEGISDQSTDFDIIEKEVIGISHAEAGAMLAESWKFPQPMINGIRYHHAPEKAEDEDKIVYIVHLADSLCVMFGFGSGIDGLNYHLSDKVLDVLNIEEKDIYNYSSFLVKEIKKVHEVMVS